MSQPKPRGKGGRQSERPRLATHGGQSVMLNRVAPQLIGPLTS